MIKKEDILINKNGSLDSNFTKKIPNTIEEIYCIYYNIKPKKCNKCNKNFRFLSFSKGYSLKCSNKGCNKKLSIEEQYLKDFNPGDTNCICGQKKKFLSYNRGYNYKCNNRNCIGIEALSINEIDKDYIDKMLNKDGIKSGKMKFLKEDITQEDLYLKYHNIVKPKCACGNYLKFIGFKKGYRNTCGSLECSNNHFSRIDNIRKTKKERYGDEKYNNRDKASDTMLTKFGTKSWLASQDRKNRNIENNASKHITNKNDLNKIFWQENFIKDNYIDYKKCMAHHNISKSYITKKRIIFEILEPLERMEKTKFNKEKEISLFIKNSIINDRTTIKPLELDLYQEKNRFAIEYDGLMWHSHGVSKHSMFNNPIEDSRRHLNKTLLCEEKEIQLYHIFENEWLDLNKRHIWISMIRDKQGLNHRIYGRKTKIKEVPTKVARDFVNENHMQGYVNASIKIGLYYNNVLVSLMTFGKSRYNKDIEYELIRFCTKKNLTVVGGGSKMLKFFERKYKPKSLLSYANRRWSTGNFYTKVGFIFIKDTKPNFFYFRPEEGILWSRNKFQKHKQKDLLEDFNTDRTGTENMYLNGYRKIFDCGNRVYVKDYK